MKTYNHSDAFKIEGVKEEFIFYSYTSKLSDNKIFNYICEKGDSIIKLKYSDTLKLIRNNGKVYLYTFKKIQN